MGVIVDEVLKTTGATGIHSAVDLIVNDVLERSMQHRWPICLERVAGLLGIVRIDYQPIPCDGLLCPIDDASYRAVIASWAPSSRQRFSLAHEIGHAVLHQFVPETRKFATRSLFMPPGHQEEEALCDLFASRLLMPSSLMEEWAYEASFALESIERLASEASASLAACCVRICEMFHVSGALVGVDYDASSGRCVVDKLYSQSKDRLSVIRTRSPLRHANCVRHAIERSSSHAGECWIPIAGSTWAKRSVDVRGWRQSGSRGRAVMLVKGHSGLAVRNEMQGTQL